MHDKAKSLIKWSELSRFMKPGGDRNLIRANKVPKIYRNQVDKLLALITEWQKEVKNDH